MRMTPRRLAHSNRIHKRLVSQVTFRKYLRKHMLTLFSDFALLMPNESYVADLGSLLPAVAAAIASIPTSFVMGRISSDRKSVV